LKPRIPAHLSRLPVRSVHCVFVVSYLTALVERGGKPSQSGEGVSEETRVALEKTQEVERLAVLDAAGQMFIVGMSSTKPDYYIEKMIRERNIGGVLLSGSNMRSEEQTKEPTEFPATPLDDDGACHTLSLAVDHEGGEVQSTPWVSTQPFRRGGRGSSGPRGGPKYRRKGRTRAPARRREYRSLSPWGTPATGLR
jgi:hypothetical protein